MSIKKIKIISSIFVFLSTFLIHFVYNFFPNDLTSIFFPVNESVWEHMKMLLLGFLLAGILEYFLSNHFKVKMNNILFSSWLGGFLSIPIYLIIYLPVYYIIGEKMWWNILVMIITIILIEIIQTWIIKQKNNKILNIITVPLIIITYIIMGYLTFNPPHTHLFFDTNEEKYGINEYATVEPETHIYY